MQLFRPTHFECVDTEGEFVGRIDVQISPWCCSRRSRIHAGLVDVDRINRERNRTASTQPLTMCEQLEVLLQQFASSPPIFLAELNKPPHHDDHSGSGGRAPLAYDPVDSNMPMPWNHAHDCSASSSSFQRPSSASISPNRSPRQHPSVTSPPPHLQLTLHQLSVTHNSVELSVDPAIEEEVSSFQGYEVSVLDDDSSQWNVRKLSQFHKFPLNDLKEDTTTTVRVRPVFADNVVPFGYSQSPLLLYVRTLRGWYRYQ